MKAVFSVVDSGLQLSEFERFKRIVYLNNSASNLTVGLQIVLHASHCAVLIFS